MDMYEEKHGMIQKLLAMLKEHASNEVDNGLRKPEGEGDMHGLEVSHVEVLPEHKMDEPTPEHDIREEEDQPHEEKMAKGGYVDAPVKSIPYESADGQPDKEGSAHEEATESDSEREAEGDVEPMFTSLFGRKKKK
jgi:hypothetical protein